MEQQFVLTDYQEPDKRVTPVTREVLETQVNKLGPGQQFRLEAPIALEGKELFALNCVCAAEDNYSLIFMLKAPEEGGTMGGYIAQRRTRSKALEILTAFVLEDTAPDFRGGEWFPIRVGKATQEETRRMKAKEKLEAEGFGANKAGKK